MQSAIVIAVHDDIEVTRRADVADGRCQYLHVVDGELVDVVSRAKSQHLCLFLLALNAACSHSSTPLRRVNSSKTGRPSILTALTGEETIVLTVIGILVELLINHRSLFYIF